MQKHNHLTLWSLSATPLAFADRSVTALFSACNPTFVFSKMWEKAIKLSKELAETYESKVFDYEGLGNLLVSLGQHRARVLQGCQICVRENVFLLLR